MEHESDEQEPSAPLAEGRVAKYWVSAIANPRLVIAGVLVVSVIVVTAFGFIHPPDLKAMAAARVASTRSQTTTGKEESDPTAAPLPSQSQAPADTVRKLLHVKPSPAPTPSVAVHATASSTATATATVAPTATPGLPPDGHVVFGASPSAAPAQQVADATAPQPAASGGIGYAPPASLRMGAVIHARLTTKIDSTQPGIVLAQTVEPVYSSRKPFPELIPSGAQLVGSDTGLSEGGTRDEPTWVRVNFPDGTAFNFAERSADQSGTSGIPGRLDRHTGRAVGAALTQTVIGAIGNLTSRSSTVNIGSAVADPQIPKPTLYVEQGTRVDIIVSRDLALDPVSP